MNVRLKAGIASLHPAYFALVMATGIVSISAHLMGLHWIAEGLFWLNVVAYLTLWGLTLARLALNFKELLADLVDHLHAFGFFTIVAGSCVLGMQCLLLHEFWIAATALWCLAIVVWMFLTCSIFTILMVKENKPPIEHGLNGGWLLSVVATQSLSLLGTALATRFPSASESIHFAALTLWLGGGMHYIWIISLIFYRYTFFSLSASDLSPPYWINMGAMAISTVAGAALIAHAEHARLLSELLPFLKGFTIFFWATATWWIPMLLLLFIWRHFIKRFPLVYNPLYWGAVFPLGMYSVCTFRLAQALDLPFLMPTAVGFLYLASAAWAATMVGLVKSLLGINRPAATRAQ